MGFFDDAWDFVKDIGAGIISVTLGTLVHYIYIAFVYSANIFNSKKRISDCLIKVLEDLDLFSSNVNLSKVRIIENAIGLRGAGLTNRNTIYISGSFDEIDRLRLLLHELKHVEQYLDMGYVKFVVIYDFQMVRYGYENAPLEIEAEDFARQNRRMVLSKYNADCKTVADPDSPVFTQMIIDEDWTMLLDLN